MGSRDDRIGAHAVIPVGGNADVGLDSAAVGVVTAAAASSALLGSLASMWLAQRIGFVSRPNPIVADHVRPVAYLGGLGVAIGVLAGMITLRSCGVAVVGPGSWPLLWCGMAFMLLGLYDDARTCSPPVKFALQIAVAAICVGFGCRASPTGIESIDAVASALWIVAVVNAFNFLDVSDGLLASLCIPIFAALALLSVEPWVAIAVVGACFGFLPMNAPPAKVFLGDAGSHLLGMLAACLCLRMATETSGHPFGWTIAMLVLSVPIFETAFICVARIRAGIPPWRGSPDHFALRMRSHGIGRARVNTIASVGALATSSLAVAVRDASGTMHAAAVAVVGLAGGLCWRWLLGAGGTSRRASVAGKPSRDLRMSPDRGDESTIHGL